MKKMMAYFQIMFLVCTTFLSGFKGEEPLRLLNDDVLGLIVFKTDLHDPFSRLHSWNQDDISPCSWSYVQCDPVTSRVSSLLLEGLGLSGKIGRGLQKLQHLKVLSLSKNNISGTISPELGLITSLERLDLSYNTLSGGIDPSSWTNLVSSIKFLDFSENSLSGPLPDILFENCSSLRSLSFSGNSFEGPIPSTLSKCNSLNNLNLSSNHFSGNLNFVSGFWTLTRLRTLDLSYNALTGPVPNGVAVIHYLKDLRLQGNQFSGLVPADIGLCPHLNKLDLCDNVFTGTLPNSLQQLKSLKYMSICKNMLDGDFPQWIGKMSSLEYVDFSSNSFKGFLPSSTGNLKSLTYLSLADNLFNGSIPESLFSLGLSHVDLSRNKLSGSIPSASSKLFESLEMMDLSANQLTGNIPEEMGLFSKLRYLNLSYNTLKSRIPPELGYSQNLTVLDLSYSSFFGPIPGDICESGSLRILQLDGNSLTGPVPEEIGNCSSLYLLSLSHNNLSDSIPRSISMLKKLKILKLEYNELSGEIPQELGKMENLLAVNISYNKLIGRLPVGGIFPSLNPSALNGNLGICSPLLKGPCKMNAPKPLVIDPFSYGYQNGGETTGNDSKRPKQYPPHKFLSVSAIISISAAVLIAAGVLVISLLNISARRRLTFVENSLESLCSSSARSGTTLSSGKLIWFNSKTSPDWNLSAEMLLNKATEIGGGVFGTVYRASFGDNGRNVAAIKKLATSNIIQSQEDFDREVRILGRARHPNLVELRGYYWTPELKLLVTNYEPNGSLQAKLEESPPLSWSNRFKIIMGTAKGLAHLHHSFRPPIIHYNIKPSNILLDENLNPKLSDFGLTRLLKKLEKHVVSNRFKSALGYVAPELACQSLRVNEKCDIYGFGVLILELVTGRRAVEYGEDNVVILNDHVRILLEQGNVLECVDPGMCDYPEDEVSPVLKLALVCTSHVPSDRPSMSDVVQILQVIKAPVPSRT
ncbi:probably inactive leucine-rich repeat receptor-like protein kinase At3g28040 [Apium graveolens]|uniref:probably inactive leucine-rich repeat receptor-like protein kinase At3g28040 n=1 Tax=Apium graveolens TaxID=4045 RepID=UPI003D7B868A